MRTLILTPNRNLCCGMYQLAKDLAKEFDGDIKTRTAINRPHPYTKDGNWIYNQAWKYERVITFLYPMHQHGKYFKKHYGTKWICYNQGIPPVTKTYFPNFWRRQAMKYINWRNNITMKGADEYWNVTEREQKPRWTEKKELDYRFVENIKMHKLLQFGNADVSSAYAIYLGRTTDYKNYIWLKQTVKELKILLIHPENLSDDIIHALLSNAKMLVTASIWEGYGRSVNEAQALKIYTVCFDTGAHDRLVKYGSVVPNCNFELFKQKIKEFWYDRIEDRKG